MWDINEWQTILKSFNTTAYSKLNSSRWPIFICIIYILHLKICYPKTLVCALLRINDCSMLLNELFSYFLSQNQTKSAFSLRLIGQFFHSCHHFLYIIYPTIILLSFYRLYIPLCAMLLFETLVWDYSQWVNLDFNPQLWFVIIDRN